MFLLSKILLLSFLNFPSDSVIGKYFYHDQSCAYYYLVNNDFELELKKSNEFVLIKKTFDSRTQKTKSDITTGFWSLDNNKIVFKPIYSTNKFPSLPVKIIFNLTENKLLKVSSSDYNDFPPGLVKMRSL
jgi:thiamine pyrophosphokinase